MGLGKTFKVFSISTFLSVRLKRDLNQIPCSSIPPFSPSRLGQFCELFSAPLSLTKARSCCICMCFHPSSCPVNQLWPMTAWLLQEPAEVCWSGVCTAFSSRQGSQGQRWSEVMVRSADREGRCDTAGWDLASCKLKATEEDAKSTKTSF